MSNIAKSSLLCDDDDGDGDTCVGVNVEVLRSTSHHHSILLPYRSLLGVVSSLSPSKMLLAPARKHSAWSVTLNETRPADRRITDRGITTRAVAMQRTRSSADGGSWPCGGVHSCW